MEMVKEISPHAEPILIIAVTAILGLLLGSIKVKGMKLGVAGMLFSGLLMGHLGLRLEPELLSFLKEFGLVLFVFTVGLQLGPGFFNSLKRDGAKLNAIAILVVLLSALVIYGGGRLLHWQPGVMAGIFSGATTNTPSLGAAQQVLSMNAPTAPQADTAAMAYAVVYPFGVIGIILALVMLRAIFRINPAEELKILEQRQQSELGVIQRVTWEVENTNMNGVIIRNIPGLGLDGVVISRIRRKGETEAESVKGDTPIHIGDRLLAVGPSEALQRTVLAIGKVVEEDLRQAPSHVVSKRIIVTHKRAIGKTIRDLQISERFGVTVTRVSRHHGSECEIAVRRHGKNCRRRSIDRSRRKIAGQFHPPN